MVLGVVIATIELIIYFIISYQIRKYAVKLQDIDVVTYYWMTLTVLTMIWECSFIYNYEYKRLYYTK